MSPTSKRSSDKEEDEILIDFATPEPSHISPPPLLSDIAVTDDGEILFVGPDCAGTQAADDGKFWKFPTQSQTSPRASDLAVGDDGGIFVVGPDFAGTGLSNHATVMNFPRQSHSSPQASGLPVAGDGEIFLVGSNLVGPPPADAGKFGNFQRQSNSMCPASGVPIADDGGIRLMDPYLAGTRPPNEGTFGNFPKQLQTFSPASDIAVADDGEILLVGPDFAGNWSFLDGGIFGDFPSETSARSTTNPFLADILASEHAAIANGVDDLPSVDEHYIPSDELFPVTKHGASNVGIRRSPLVRRDLSLSADQSEGTFTSPHANQLEVSSVSRRSLGAMNAGGSRLPAGKIAAADESLALHPVTVSNVLPSLSPVLRETNIDDSNAASASTTAVTLVVSSLRSRSFAVVCD